MSKVNTKKIEIKATDTFCDEEYHIGHLGYNAVSWKGDFKSDTLARVSSQEGDTFMDTAGKTYTVVNGEWVED